MPVQPKIHRHQQGGAVIVGILLGPGAALLPTDYYAALDGTWAQCPSLPLLTHVKENGATMWVRKVAIPKATVHRHPMSGDVVYGVQLEPGDIMQPTDFYDSTSGSWERCPEGRAGAIIQKGCETKWVRPVEEAAHA